MTDLTPERLAQIEADAPAIIHNAMRYDRMEFTPPWVNGNSDAEDEARQTVRILRIPDLIAALEAAQAENAKLRAALRPFAMYPDDPSMCDHKMTGSRISYGIIRAAHAALESNP